MLKVKRETVMRNEKSQFNNIGISSEPDMPRIRHLMKIGLTAGVMALIGDERLQNYQKENTERQTQRTVTSRNRGVR